MGLMDKVKAQATQVAAKAQEAGKVGQAKLEAVQAKRKADTLLSELGKVTFDAHEGRGAPGDEKRAADLMEQLRQYEAEYGQIDADAPVGSTVDHDATSSAPTSTPSSSGGIPEPSSGDGEL